jgi:ferritin
LFINNITCLGKKQQYTKLLDSIEPLQRQEQLLTTQVNKIENECCEYKDIATAYREYIQQQQFLTQFTQEGDIRKIGKLLNDITAQRDHYRNIAADLEKKIQIREEEVVKWVRK